MESRKATARVGITFDFRHKTTQNYGSERVKTLDYNHLIIKKLKHTYLKPKFSHQIYTGVADDF